MLDSSPIRRFTDAKTKQPSQRSRAKLSKLLAYEIESAARCVRKHIADGDMTGMEDCLRFIERQISFMREVNS
jgi:hypothetical protein